MPDDRPANEPAPASCMTGEAADQRKRTRQLCCVTGLAAGMLGVFIGAMVATALGIVVPLPGASFLQGRAPVPVQLGTRPRADGQGAVLQVRNMSPTPLRSVVIRLTAPGHSNPRTIELDSWEPGAVAEIGENDGWLVAAGQTLSITAEEFQPVMLTLN